MSERTTTIISKSDAAASAGTVVLASVALGAGLLLVDYVYSPEGHSAWEKIVGKTKRGHFFTGADAASEMKRLPAYAQQVVNHAIAAESDQTTLTQLADNLQAAGFAQTAANVRAKVHG